MKNTFIFQAAKEENGFRPCFGVAEFPDLLPSSLENHNKILTRRQKITIVFDYPMNTSAKFTYTSKNGFTYRSFFKCVYGGYKKIYKEEGPNPGMIPGMWNRRPTHGKYGIWGHVITDLVLTSATEVKPGIFTLGIDS